MKFGLIICALFTVPGRSGAANDLVAEIRPGIFKIGQVELNKTNKVISFPAAVNMTQGNVEYLLVTESGKVHESVFRTAIEPSHLQVAKLLLDSNRVDGQTNLPQDLRGPSVLLWVNWQKDGVSQKAAAESFVVNTQEKAVMKPGPWVFNGSRIVNGTFIAQRDGSIVTIQTDIDALINNPRAGRENDDIWLVNSNAVPTVGTVVQVNIQFLSKP